MLQGLSVIQTFIDRKVSLYIQNYNLETLNPDKSVNPMTMFMVQILASVATMEAETTKVRFQSGYRNNLLFSGVYSGDCDRGHHGYAGRIDADVYGRPLPRGVSLFQHGGGGGHGDELVKLKVMVPSEPNPELETFLSGWTPGSSYDPRRDMQS